MSDFQFLQNPLTGQWVISAPRRAKRPDMATGFEPVCPFCVGREQDELEVYRVGGVYPDGNWKIRVIPNKFPFAPIHEVIIHSPDHHKTFDELPQSQTELILATYRQRYNTYKEKGQIYIFHNHGTKGGESLPHPHSQLVVIPKSMETNTPRLHAKERPDRIETTYFYLFSPDTSQWPDEVWVAPLRHGRVFGEITDAEISDLASLLARLITILDIRHGHEFPYNFYIYPGGEWYLRLTPREKTLGGFEVGTGIFVNTQDPRETMQFLQEHFFLSQTELIDKAHRASYYKSV